jgi:hypothetical protein
MSGAKVTLADALAGTIQPCTSKIAGEVNAIHVKLARFEGECDWHAHADEDELFLVSRGVEPRPGAVTDSCDVLLLEPATPPTPATAP